MQIDPRRSFRAYLLLCGFAVTCASASIFDNTGYNQLAAELGGALPTGDGVPVMIVEANTDANLLPSGLPVDGAYDFTPDLGNGQFVGKTFTVHIPPGTIGAESSTHATAVGFRYFGNTQSMAPGITDIESFEANHWLGDGQLGALSATAPIVSAHMSRVGNHSYVGSTGDDTEDLNILERVDWLVHTDEFIQVVGSTSSIPIHNHAFNAIRVGFLRTTGSQAGSTGALPGGVYAAGRVIHDLVATETAASNAAPRVAAFAALLVEVANKNPGLSNGSVTDRNAQTIYHGETAEVVRALLMAGADRDFVTSFATSGLPYTVNTANGLHDRYGAGNPNIYNAYHMLAAGEFDSVEDGGPATVGQNGFDYDTAFGGDNASNTQATYRFTANATIAEFAASLVWHVDVDIAEVIAGNEDTAAVLRNLDLRLFRETGGGDVLVGSSLSTIENTENIWLKDLEAGTYKLVVDAVGPAFEWDYGIAWRAEPIPEPASAIVLIAFAPVLIRRKGRRRVSPEVSHHGTV